MRQGAQAAVDLYQSALRWRYGLFATAGVTLLAFIFPPTCSPGGATYTTPAPVQSRAPLAVNAPSTPLQPVAPAPYDPASDQRLQTFVDKVTSQSTEPRAGYRCERLADALLILDRGDRPRIAQRSSPPAKAAQGPLAMADNCVQQLDASNGHFAVLARNVQLADQTHYPRAIEDAATAYKTLDGFDRSRDRFKTEESLMGKGKAYAEMIDTSAARVDAFDMASQRFGSDASGATAVALADALTHLSEFDRARLSPSQNQALAAGQAAAEQVRSGRTRLARLVHSLAQRDLNPGAGSDQQLLEAVGNITPFDKDIATTEERIALDKARALVAPLAWPLLDQRLAALGQDPSPANYQAVIQVYELLATLPGEAFTPAQQSALEGAKAAATAMRESDQRLAALVAAADRWQHRTDTPDADILDTLRALKPLDQLRLKPEHTAAIETLSRAEAIIKGPAVGLTAQTKPYVPIALEASGPTGRPRFLSVLTTSLQRKGYLIVVSPTEAALVLTVSIDGPDQPKQGTKGPYIAYSASAHANVRVVWVADNSYLFSETIEGGHLVGINEVRGDAVEEAKDAALHDIIDRIVESFEKAAAARSFLSFSEISGKFMITG